MPWATVDLVQAKVRRLVADGYVTRTQLYEQGKRGDSLYALTAKGLKVLMIEDMSDYINPGIVKMHNGEIEEVSRKAAPTKVDFLGSEAKSIHTKVDLLASEATHIIERTINKENNPPGVEDPPPSGEVDSSPTPSKEAGAVTPPQSPSPLAASGAPAGGLPLAGVPGPAAGRQPSRPLPAEMSGDDEDAVFEARFLEIQQAYPSAHTFLPRARHALRRALQKVEWSALLTAAKAHDCGDPQYNKSLVTWLDGEMWGNKPPAKKNLTGNVAIEGNASAGDRLKQRRARPNPADLAKALTAPMGRNQS